MINNSIQQRRTFTANMIKYGLADFFRIIVPTVKRLIGIKDISLWRKRWTKRVGKIVYHKKYSARDIVRVMCQLGMEEGSVVCVHASMMQFYNFTDSAKDLIDEILRIIGKEGTLMMPAFPIKPKDGYDNYVFNPLTDKTGAGYLAEVFRKYPGVKRSCNVHHSVCAIGKYVDYLIKDHTNGENCWDKLSPWYRISELNGLVFNLGMPHSYIGTFHHCVEGILHSEHPYWGQFFNYRQKYMYLLDGKVHTYYNIEGNIIRKTREKNIFKYLTIEDWHIAQISNLEIKVFNAHKVLNKMLELGAQGVSVYYVPSPNKYKF